MGSSFELSQRLDESGSLVVPNYDQPLQLFDIRRHATGTWKEYRDRTRQRETRSETHQAASKHVWNLPVTDQPASTLIQNDTNLDNDLQRDDARKSWFKACQPPQLSQSLGGDKTEGIYLHGIIPTLTPEGKRQVRS